MASGIPIPNPAFERVESLGVGKGDVLVGFGLAEVVELIRFPFMIEVATLAWHVQEPATIPASELHNGLAVVQL